LVDWLIDQLYKDN